MRFRVAQDTLHQNVLSTHCVQVRRQSAAKRVPSIPRYAIGLKLRLNYLPRECVQVDRNPIARMKDQARLWIAYGPAVLL